MNTIKLFLTSAVFILSAHLHAQVTLEWAARYVGARADVMALDSAGNIIVAGDDNQSPAGFSIVKFNSSGQLVWARRFTAASATPKSIGVDPQGNIYIGANGGGNYIVIKYNPAGVQQWFKIYSGTGTWSHTLSDMSLDNNSFGVVVTGYAQFSSGGRAGCLTIKLSQTTGDSVWRRSYNPNPNLSHCLDMDIGDSRIIYINGQWSPASLTPPDFLTLSYNQDGNLRWARTWNGPANRLDVAYDIASDRNGNVYVTGYSEMDTTTGNEDIATIKYDSSGNLKWVRFYDGPATSYSYDRGYFVKTDHENNIIVAGLEVGINTWQDYCILKYDPLGNLLWNRQYNNNQVNLGEYVHGLAVDKFGSVYVTGIGDESSTRYKITTIKYDKNGNQIWLRKYPDSDTISAPTAIIVDKNLNVYIAGQIQIQGGGAALVLKYSQPLGIEPVSGIQPVRFKLYQNYPNPFNPNTKIRFDIPLKSFVKLTVYDALGKTVAVLVNQELDAGSYETGFSASELSSGVYFYQIEAGSGKTEYKDTGKMLVIK